MYDDEIAKAIYENGATLVRLGIIDAETAGNGVEERYLTAILNVYAGILLILKSRLAEESAKIGNALIYSGKGRKRTIKFQEIKERYAQIDCDAVNSDSFWDQMRSLKDFRNNAEHKFVDLKKDVVEGHMLRMHDVLQILFDAVVGVPASVALDKQWMSLSSHTVVAREIRMKRDAAFKELQWLNPRLSQLVANDMCPECGYSIICIDEKAKDGMAHHSTLKCGSCAARFMYDEMMERILQAQDFDDCGWRMKDWSMRLEHIGMCPECYRRGFDVDTNMCYCCGAEQEYRCDRCSKKLTSCEVSEMICDENSRVLCGDCRNTFDKEGLLS